MKIINKILLLLLLVTTFVCPSNAQEQFKSKNLAFKSGETLQYNLFFNWKFVWFKVGSATMTVSETVYKGIPAYRTYLISRGSKLSDRYFVMRDTLKSYMSKDLLPLYATKHAFEGHSYRVDDIWFKYRNNKVFVDQRHVNKHGEISCKKDSSEIGVFDMLGMLMHARSFDPESYKDGLSIPFMLADGKGCKKQKIIFKGRDDFSMNNSSTKYHCLIFSYVEEDEKGKEEEILRFYVTDDKNHLPVRLDMNLNFGSAKAFLVGAKGIRNPQTSKFK